MTSRVAENGRGHVLLVEDDPGIMTAMTLVLQLEGYQVTQAANGQEALGRLAEIRPDLILTDYMMPRMNGMQMMRSARQDSNLADIPAIMITGVVPDEAQRDELLSLLLSKPVSARQLLDAVSRFVDPAVAH
jgi:CheY-like chemotaxis protein